MKTWNFINGWSLKIARVNRVMVVSVVMITPSQQIQADEIIEQPTTPSIEFLEFLGAGVTVDEEFLDPMNYSEIDTDSQQGTTQKVANDKTRKDDE